MLPPVALADQPTSSITGKHIHKVHNKIPHPTFVISWTLDGRRLFTGNSAGEITLWDGKTFNFDGLVSSGRNEAIRAMTWSRSGDFLLIGDGGGSVGYYEPTLKPLYVLQSHKKAIRGLSFAPTDSKFVTCSDDSTLAIWDFAKRKCETVLEGHNWDVRCVDWHPYNSLIVSGAKDKLIKLWDSKSKTNIHTWQGHKGDVSKVTWNLNGNWFLSASRDYSMRIYDIRTMKELQVIRGNGEMCSVAWHPFHEKLFASGDANGDMSFWIAGQDTAQGRLYGAHASAIWDMKWHPFGHILCATANDTFTSFWCRNRPGEKMEDRYNDPTFVSTPTRAELEAQAQAQADINAMQVAATVATLGGGDDGDRNSAPLPVIHTEDFASSQKQHIVPGAIGMAAGSDWMSYLRSDGTSDGNNLIMDVDAAQAAPVPFYAGASRKSSKTNTSTMTMASTSIPGLGQANSGLAQRGGSFFGGSGASSSSSSSYSGRRVDTRRDDRRQDDGSYHSRDRYDRGDRNDRERTRSSHDRDYSRDRDRGDRDRDRDRDRGGDRDRGDSGKGGADRNSSSSSERASSSSSSFNDNRYQPTHAAPMNPYPPHGAVPPHMPFPPPGAFLPGAMPPPHMFPGMPPPGMFQPPPPQFAHMGMPPPPSQFPPPGSYPPQHPYPR